MGVFYIFLVVQMVLNCAKSHMVDITDKNVQSTVVIHILKIFEHSKNYTTASWYILLL